MSTLSFTAAVSALLLIATVMVAGQEARIEIGITETHAHPGQNVSIQCRAENQGENSVALQKPFADANPADPDIVFLNNEIAVPSSNRYSLKITDIGSSVKLYVLSITNTTAEDSGPYRCIIRKINVEQDQAFYVYHPVQELSFNNVSIDHGFSVVRLNESSPMDLDCIAKGSIPAADIKMFLGDREITNEHTKKMTGSEVKCRDAADKCIIHQTFTKSAMIQDFRVTYKDHNKDLKCVATVGNLPPVEAVFKMHVPFSPKFECDMNQVARLHADSFKVSCQVLSNPGNPDFVWEFMWGGEKQQLMNNDKTTDGEIHAGQTPKDDGKMEVYLEIKKVSMRHYMSFHLKSNNSIGSSQTDIKLTQDTSNPNAASVNSISAIFVLLLVLLRAHL